MPGWIKRYGMKPIRSSVSTQSELGTSNEDFTNFVHGLIFEGNDLSNIDPYLWLPDPSVSSDHIQDGEYLGWIDRDNYMNMLSEESQSDSGIFNVRYLRKKGDKRSRIKDSNREDPNRHGLLDIV